MPPMPELPQPGYALREEYTILKTPPLADWECEMFGMGRAYIMRPTVENVPNAWWRFWQFVILGNKWRRVSDERRAMAAQADDYR